MGNVTAADCNNDDSELIFSDNSIENSYLSNSSSNNSSFDSEISKTTITENSSNSTNNSSNNATNIKTTKTVPGIGCCSVLIHVKKGFDVFSYRRDSTYAANLYIKKIKWYGKEAIKEYKKTNGYFFHTIVTKNGWIISTGGPDIVWINKKLESLAGKITLKGHITKTNVKSAYNLLRKAGMGHFLIKDPSGNVGLAIYNSGRAKIKLFKMKNGEYVSVPNSPRYYRQGFIKSKSNPVNSAICLAGTDRWGVNRRNVITYDLQNIDNYTKVKVWASFDGGKLIKRNRGRPDNIIFRGHKIYAKSLPRIPSKKYIGTVVLRSYSSLLVARSSLKAAIP